MSSNNNDKRNELDRMADSILDEADRRGHGNRSVGSMVGVGVGGLMGSFLGPLGAAAGAAAGALIGGAVGDELDADDRRNTQD